MNKQNQKEDHGIRLRDDRIALNDKKNKRQYFVRAKVGKKNIDHTNYNLNF